MNRLKDESSPYLLQHADNPVDWFPWGEEAFEKAVSEDKPVLLSIGYSTCHWCHVMEHECFEDEEVAALMNENIVSIKVDREERPDIDNIYMMVCQILSQGGCGWPLNIIMTPDKRPFFAATYLPKKNRFGRIGMMELIPKLANVWKNNREEILKSADGVTDALKKVTEGSVLRGDEEPDKSTLKKAYEQLSARFDSENGGFGEAPKFPVPHNLIYLLRYHRRTGDDKALYMVTKTLDEMRKGGIYDHVGFGFHRYSTDSHWFLPHFEKMLYDQALLAMAYTEGYQLTGKEDYKRVAQEILTYVLRDMTSPEGGFYSAEDADSEGEEGKFYLWSAQEINDILGEEDGSLIKKIYNVTDEGNYVEEATGESKPVNILHMDEDYNRLAGELGTTEDELLQRLEDLKKKLFETREKRVRPSKDDKILTDWNGLMIAALAKAAAVFDNDTYTDAAERAVRFINTEMFKDSRLLHRFREGKTGIKANLDDYSFLIWGLLELYETTFNPDYLEQAVELNSEMIDLFWDAENGGFFFTPKDGEQLIVRQKEIHDGALPSGNSAAMLDLLRIGRITADTKLEEMAQQHALAFSGSLNKVPISHSMHMIALDFALGETFEVIIVGEPESDDTIFMRQKLAQEYIPGKVVIFKSMEAADKIEQIAPYTRDHQQIGGRSTAYVCRNYVCELPVTDPEKMINLIANK